PLTRLSINDRGYLSNLTPGNYPEDEEGEEGGETEEKVAAADDEKLNWDDPWPELVALEDKPTITVVTEDKEEKKFIYESDHYRFTCNVRLNRSVVSSFSTLFEATRVYCRALPLAVSGGIKNNGKYDIFLFETKQQYIEAGAPPSSAGVFMRRGNKSYIMVPLTSLGVRKVGSGYMRDRDKSNGTLVHEITHQLTPGPYFARGARGWFSEGLAEYLTSTPYRSGRFKVKSNFDDIVAYATAYGKKDTRGRALGEEFTAPALVDYMTMPYSSFTGGDANFNYGLGLVLTTYFLHLDGEGDGARMKEFLKELRTPRKKSDEAAAEGPLESEPSKGLQSIGAHGRRALEKLLDGRTFEELQDDITTGWRRKRVKITFRKPR
ncbi:hypothetical protein N9165_02740, partial [Akkermansiaceae bacterium]|nr:hypothetical protein [Akkermansiaceae bacterium]